MNWKLLKSQIVFDNFTKIEERTYQMPDGQVKDFYIKVARPTVGILALTSDNKVITAAQFRPGPNAILYDLPGGFIDGDEAPPDAAARELLEETGYAGELQFITECFQDAYTTMVQHCFVATNCKLVDQQKLDDGEHVEVRLLELPDFIKLARAGQMTNFEIGLLGLDKLGLLS